VHQRQLSVPSLRGRLMSTSESWGVNGHTVYFAMHSPRICGPAASASVRLRASKRRSWVLEARERTLLFYYQNEWLWPLFRGCIKVISITALHLTLNASETVRDRGLVPKDHQ